MKIRKMLTAFAAFAVCLAFAGTVSAHTTSLGYVPGNNNGEVTFWAGSYHSGGVNEGTLTLAGINGTSYAANTLSFNLSVTSTMPTGLTDGVNNFYWSPFGHSADQGIGGGVRIWQGVTFGGLNPGDYSFSCGATCGTTAVWASWTTDGTGTLTLTGQNIGGGGTGNVPEPVTGLLLGVGVMGLAAMRRRG